MAQAPATLSLSGAQAIARRFDLIAAQPSTFSHYVDGMRAANPNVRLLLYVNGAFSLNDSGTRYPSGWYARDGNGNMITSVYNNLLMDVARQDWKDEVASRCATGLASSGYDGCFIDTLGTAIFTPGYASGTPVHSGTGLEWTPSEWIAATTSVANTVRTRIAPGVVMANGLAMGEKYFDTTAPTKQLLSGSDSGMVELFVRPPFVPADKYRNYNQWKLDLALLSDAASMSKPTAAVTKVWVSATQQQLDSLHRFALATFLLGANGTQYFSFTSAQTWSAITGDHPYEHAAVGPPMGDVTRSSKDGTYRRVFANGLVFVNPTSATVGKWLNGSYRTLDGALVRRITLPPNSGEVLVKA